MVFSGKGAIGIGQQFPSSPTEKLDVVGNARFRGVPVNGGQSLMLGYQIGANVNDVRLSRLVFPNDNTQVLLGDGTFGSSPSEMFVGCNSISQLQENKHVDLNDNNVYFVGNNGST